MCANAGLEIVDSMYGIRTYRHGDALAFIHNAAKTTMSSSVRWLCGQGFLDRTCSVHLDPCFPTSSCDLSRSYA